MAAAAAAAAFLLFGEESESERGEDDEQSRPQVKGKGEQTVFCRKQVVTVSLKIIKIERKKRPDFVLKLKF
jgi:hypothetical protein